MGVIKQHQIAQQELETWLDDNLVKGQNIEVESTLVAVTTLALDTFDVPFEKLQTFAVELNKILLDG